jgi:enoyl-[acyl-carrier-protein] reductase (NADH)
MADNQFTTHTALFDLSGKYALVTGGTRGIGMMIARGLLQAGARVVISSRKADTCAEAQHLLSEFGDVQAIPADLSRHDECQHRAEGLPIKTIARTLKISRNTVQQPPPLWLLTFPVQSRCPELR